MVRWKHIDALSTKCAPLRQVEVENSAVALDSLNGLSNVRDERCDAVNAILGFLAYGAIHKFAYERLRKKGVPQALIRALADDYVDVAHHAKNAFDSITGRFFSETLPDLDELQKRWAKVNQNITAKLKPAPECK
jgi:hypothetical protein